MKVFLIAAVSVDGFIARHSSELANWTSKEDKNLFVELTKHAGVVVMGGTTFRTIGRALPGRRMLVYSNTLQPGEGVEIVQEPPAELVARLKNEGCQELAVCGGASIYQQFMEAGVVDELYVTIEPVLFGTGISLLEKATTVELDLLETRPLNEHTVMMHYEVKHGSTH